jgi:AcrR family transcriptional regulator
VPRPARFTDDTVLDAALAVVARQGPAVAVADIGAELGGPVGSIYHRFSSREVLLVRLWLRSVARFQAGLFAIADEALGERVLVELALHVPRYCRDYPDEARALTLFRQDRLLADCPESVRDAVRDVNLELESLARRLTRQRFGSAARAKLRLTVLATRVCPYGLVRPYLGRAVPPLIDDAVEAAAISILALGDR